MSDTTAQNYRDNLYRARQKKPSSVNNEINSGSKNKKTIKKSGGKRRKTINPFTILAQIDMLNDMPYFSAMLSSLLKELLDIALSFTIVIPILFSILNCIFGIMMMQLAKFSEKKEKVHSRFMVRVAIYVIGSTFDSLPVLNFLPMSVATTLIVYIITLYERANTKKTEKVSA